MSGPPGIKGSRVTKLPTLGTLGAYAMSSQFASQAKGNIVSGTEFGGLYQLKKQAEKMGLTPEIKELAEGVEELSELIQRKNYELSILEAFALESPDENITDLRNQLFLAVKLIHSDEIETLLNDADTERRFSNHSHLDSNVKLYHDEAKEFKAGLFSRIRNAYDKRKSLKKELKKVKENFKRRQNYAPTSSEDAMCESSG